MTVTSAADIRARQVYYNVPYEDMHAPAVGPAHPFNKDGLAAGMRNHRAGHVEVSTSMLLAHHSVMHNKHHKVYAALQPQQPHLLVQCRVLTAKHPD